MTYLQSVLTVSDGHLGDGNELIAWMVGLIVLAAVGLVWAALKGVSRQP